RRGLRADRVREPRRPDDSGTEGDAARDGPSGAWEQRYGWNGGRRAGAGYRLVSARSGAAGEPRTRRRDPHDGARGSAGRGRARTARRPAGGGGAPGRARPPPVGGGRG